VTSSRRISDAKSTTQSCEIRAQAAVLESENRDAERKEQERNNISQCGLSCSNREVGWLFGIRLLWTRRL